MLYFSDRLLKWSEKDGFYTSFQVTGGLWDLLIRNANPIEGLKQ